MMRDGGKGDTPRPLGVPMDVFDANFDRIFGTAKFLKENIKEVNAEFDKAYNEYKEKNNEELSKLRSETKDDTNPNSDSTS
jgi:gas vesicle protein